MQTIDLSKVVIPQINYLQTLPDTNTNLYPLAFRINGIDMNSFGLIIEFHHILIHSRIQMESKRSFLWYFLLGLSPIYLLSKTNINWFEYLNLSCVTE